MDREEQKRMLDAAMLQLQSAHQEVHTAQRQVAYLQQVVDGLQGLLYPRTETGSIELYPDSLRALGPTASAMDNVSARKAVITVLHRNPNRGLTSRQIYGLILDYGLANPDFTSGHAAYDTALRRIAAEPSSFVLRDEATATFIYRPGDPHEQSSSDSWHRLRGQMHGAELQHYGQQFRSDNGALGGANQL